MTGRVVPWASWAEWEKERKALAKGDTRALKQAELWLTRGRVPLAVEATLALQTAMLHYDGSRASRLALSSAISRAVNGATESAQTGKHAASVATLASRLGIPRFVVDLRHESSHGELPNAHLLRQGAQQLLSWLQSAYWDTQYQRLLDTQQEVHSTLLSAVSSSVGEGVHAALVKLKDTCVPVDAPHIVASVLIDGVPALGCLPVHVSQTASESALHDTIATACALWQGLAPEIIRSVSQRVVQHADEYERTLNAVLKATHGASSGCVHRRDVAADVVKAVHILLQNGRINTAHALACAVPLPQNSRTANLLQRVTRVAKQTRIRADASPPSRMRCDGFQVSQADAATAHNSGGSHTQQRNAFRACASSWHLDDTGVPEPIGAESVSWEDRFTHNDEGSTYPKDGVSVLLQKSDMQPPADEQVFVARTNTCSMALHEHTSTDDALVQHLRSRRRKRLRSTHT